MRAYAAGGNSAQALRAYDDCKKLLADELRVSPSPETDAIAHALRRLSSHAS
jgi:DNA-binding SARP family transcriptional activator